MLLSNLDILLALALIRHRDKKDIKKVVLKLIKRAPPATVNGILSRILHSKSMAKEIDVTLHAHDDLAAIMKELDETGHHGMVIIGNDIYPVKLDIIEEDDWQWARENEQLVAMATAHQTMNDLSKNRLHGTVVLFATSDFTGSPRDFNIERQTKFSVNLQRFGDTQYFKQRNG